MNVLDTFKEHAAPLLISGGLGAGYGMLEPLPKGNRTPDQQRGDRIKSIIGSDVGATVATPLIMAGAAKLLPKMRKVAELRKQAALAILRHS